MTRHSASSHGGHKYKVMGRLNKSSSSSTDTTHSHNQKRANIVSTWKQQAAVNSNAGPASDSPLCHSPRGVVRQLLHFSLLQAGLERLGTNALTAGCHVKVIQVMTVKADEQ